MTEQAKQTPQELKQSILDRLEEAKKSVEELSEDDLASIVGGASSGLPERQLYTTMSLSETQNHPVMPQRRTRIGAPHPILNTTMAIPENSKL